MQTWRRFSARARAGILLAQSAAGKAGAESVTPAHLIVGLASLYGKASGLIARQLLRCRRRPDFEKPNSSSNPPPLSVDVRTLLSSAMKQARSANEPVEVKHLWSALRSARGELRFRAVARTGSIIEAARSRSIRWLAHSLLRRIALPTWSPTFTRNGSQYLRFAGSVLRAGILLLMVSMTSVMVRAPQSKLAEYWVLSCFAFSLLLLVFVFPTLALIGSWKMGIRSSRLLALAALIVGTLNLAGRVTAHLSNTVFDAEGWRGWLLYSIVTALPLTAMLVYFEATHLARQRSRRRPRWPSWPASFPAFDRPTTDAFIQRWQSEGLMPEIETGKVLVWKQVVDLGEEKLPRYRPTRWLRQQFEPGTYLGMRLAPYRLGEAYHYEGSMVCAGPYGALYNYVREIGQSGIVLAIAADRNAMTALPQHHFSGGVFLAPNGTPLAAYRATRVAIDDFEFRLLEGADALRWLHQPPVTPSSSREQGRFAILRKLSSWWKNRRNKR